MKYFFVAAMLSNAMLLLSYCNFEVLGRDFEVRETEMRERESERERERERENQSARKV